MTKEEALFQAVREGDLEEVKRLIAEKVDVNTKDGWNCTPLMYAAIWGHLRVVQFLVENGANVNDKDQWDETALIRAAANGYNEIVEFLNGGEEEDQKVRNNKNLH